MPKPKKTTKTRGGKPPVGLTDEQIFAYAGEINTHKKVEAEAKGRWKHLQDTIVVPEFVRRKTKSLGRAGMNITLVEPESVEYDGAGIRKDKDIKAAVKRRIFRAFVDLNRLTPEERKAVLEVVGRKVQCVLYVLDPDALSAEVQAGNIDPEVLNEYTTINEKSKYLSISLGQD